MILLPKSTSRKIRTIFSSLLIGSAILCGGCLSLFQPVNKVDKEYNYIDLDAQAVRLAKPIKFLHIFTVKAELLAKNESGEWESIGYGTIPPGAYIKGRAPEAYRTNIMLEEEAK